MRVKGGVKGRRRHKRLLKLSEGFKGRRRNCFRLAKLGVQKALQYSYRDRRAKKRDFRSLWVVRINAATRTHGLSYSRFIRGLRMAGIEVDRKILAELALRDPSAFGVMVDKARTAVS